MTRPSISRGLRESVWSACGRACSYCDAPLGRRDPFHLDHVEPFSAGGPTARENLVAACRGCNSGASSALSATFWAKRRAIRRRRGFLTSADPQAIAGRFGHLSPRLCRQRRLPHDIPGIFPKPISSWPSDKAAVLATVCPPSSRNLLVVPLDDYEQTVILHALNQITAKRHEDAAARILMAFARNRIIQGRVLTSYEWKAERHRFTPIVQQSA